MRAGSYGDIEYFVEASREFCSRTPFVFDAEGHEQNIRDILDTGNGIVVVDGDPVCCHCVAHLVPSFWNPSEFVCKIYTTWGPGGMACFREVERLATERGAKYLIADSFIEPRIMKFYQRNAMTEVDRVFLKEL